MVILVVGRYIDQRPGWWLGNCCSCFYLHRNIYFVGFARPVMLKMKTLLFGIRSGLVFRIKINLKTVTDPLSEK
jgi:hypothetical protein